MGPIRLPIDEPEGADQPDHTDHIEKQASYPGEDTSFTSQRELNGWFAFEGKLI
jgi:hypothetical protein